MKNKYVVGTRGSALALWQTRYVANLLRKAWPLEIQEIEERIISTKGDERLEKALHTFGGKGAFTEELEAELLAGKIDFAVHSLKDMPTKMSRGLVIGAIPVRAAAMDAFVSATGIHLKDLSAGAKVGTSSLRRTAQLRHFYPHLEVVPIRGNVQTRLAKIEEGLAGVILAKAGLERLGLGYLITHDLSAPEWLPAAGQGALAIQCRVDDQDMLRLLEGIHDFTTAQSVGAERAFLAAMEGGCQVPIGVSSLPEGAQIRLCGLLASLDGKKMIRREVCGSPMDYEALGQALAADILASGGQEIWHEVCAELEGI